MNWEEIFKYDETSPTCLRWNCDYVVNGVIRKYKGEVAGRTEVNKKLTKKYLFISYQKKQYAMHRIIWELFNGKIAKDQHIDHLDGDTKNNIISNLECKSIKGNSQNRGMNRNNITGVKGVSYYVYNNGKHLGYFVATYKINGVQCSKSFTVEKYGPYGAFSLAIYEREKVIKLLNSMGENYTERHCEVDMVKVREMAELVQSKWESVMEQRNSCA